MGEIEAYLRALGVKARKFEARKSIRVNTLKIGVKELTRRLDGIGLELEKIPWSEQGFYIGWNTGSDGGPQGLKLGNILEHALGYYFIQDAISMLIPRVLLDGMGKGGWNGVKVLDLAAAPGAKNTQLSQIMSNEGVVVANDASSGRIKALAMNVQRMGCVNTIVTHTDGRNFPNWGNDMFDAVLVDAPCSGWGQASAAGTRGAPGKYAPLQKDLILAGFDCLKPGGSMVYSTCTFSVEENEKVVQHLLDNRVSARVADAQLDGISDGSVKYEKGLKKFEGKAFDESMHKCARIYPWLNDSDGFFVCKLTKDENA